MRTVTLALLATCGLVAVAASAAPSISSGSGEAAYWMSAETVSGLATGLPAGQTKSLQLQLGTGQRPSARPAAEHLPPSALQAGARLPLTSPQRLNAAEVAGTAPVANPSAMKGRMLIFWGCGEHAPAGQPLVVDLAGMAPGKAGRLASGLQPAAMSPPSPHRHASYGEWPNADGRTSIPAPGSLVGEHVVRGNYTPELRFSLAAADDFLDPLQPTSTSLASGAVKVSWPAVGRARGTFAAVMGAAQDGTIVMWTSSKARLAGMMLPDYLAPAEVARLLAAGALLSPQTTECTVPADVIKAGGMTLQMTAFGPETNLRSPSTSGRWAVKVRSRSSHMGMLLAPAGASGAEAAGQEAATPSKKPSRRRGLLKGLGGVLGVTVP